MPQDDSSDDNKKFFTKLEFAKRTRRSIRAVERHLERKELKRASPPKKKVLISREELLIFEDKMKRHLV